MRDAFVAALLERGTADPKIMLLTGDLGYHLFDAFSRACPGRYVNCGVAEQGMLGLAAGLALTSFRPIVYSITPFTTYRIMEQIRVDACYHNLPIIIVGIGSGYAYGNLGPTHHSCEDIAMMRSLPNMAVVCPSDAWEVRAALREALKRDSPTYLRLGKRGEPILRGGYPSGFQIGKAIILREGRDVSIVACGAIVGEALIAADALDAHGVQAQVVSMHTVKPIDERMLHEAFTRFRMVVTLEEHSTIGGLGGAVAEWMADNNMWKHETPLLRLGSPDAFFREAGERHYILEQLGLTGKHVAERIRSALQH